MKTSNFKLVGYISGYFFLLYTLLFNTLPLFYLSIENAILKKVIIFFYTLYSKGIGFGLFRDFTLRMFTVVILILASAITITINSTTDKKKPG